MSQFRNKKLFLLGLFLGLFFGGLILTAAVVGAQSIADPSSTLNQGVQMIQEPLGLPATDIRTIIARIIRVFLGLLGVIALVLMIYAGFLWMTSGGSEEKIAQSKKILTNATVGLVIILSAYTIVSFVISRLLSATTGYPEHCFDGIMNQNPDDNETGKDCGGECPSCPTVCTDPPCGFSNVFFVQQLPTAGNVCVRNVKLAVMFSEAVDISTLNQNTVIVKKKSDNSIVNGSWQLGDDRNVAMFVPSGACNPFSGDDCFEATTTYILDIDDSKQGEIKNSSGSRSLNCSLKATCKSVEFTTGEGVDRSPPVINLDVISPFQSGLVMRAKIYFTDDNGLQNASLYAGSYFIGSESLANCQKSGTTTIDWATAGMMGNYDTRGIGLDWAGNRAVTSTIVTLRPEHCFNHVHDPADNETGVDCGVDSGCGVCEGNKCTDSSQCASGYCEIIPPATDGVCIDKMKITDVSPLSGASSTFVTIAGNYFGANVGKVYFAKVANPDKNNLSDWQRALLANCGVGSKVWTSWQIIVEVPIANAVSGPIMVETASTIGKDGVIRKFFDTTNDDWGKKFGDFVINNQSRPGLCPINPDSGVPNDTRNLLGKNFGTAGGQIFFGNQQAARISWADAQISSKVPFLDKGSVGVYVKPVGKLESNSVYFYINGTVGKDDPVISEITPNHGAQGEYITITGNKFGNTRGVVWFKKDITERGDDNFPAACAGATWTDKQIIIKFPSSTSASLGNYSVWVSTGDAPPRVSAPVTFKLESGNPAPGICKIDPENGPIPFATGGNMKIYGEYFIGSNAATKNCKYGNGICDQSSDCPIAYQAGEVSGAGKPVYVLPDGFCVTYSGSSFSYPSTYQPCRSDGDCVGANKKCSLVTTATMPISWQVVNSCIVTANPSFISTSTVYFFQTGASSTAKDGRVLATEVSSVLPNLITLRPPAGTQTGPVAAYRSTDNKFGNGVAFTVNDCVKNKGCTESGTHCCTSGGDQGICRPNGELCAGETRSTGYVWRFSTRDIPAPLTVIEKCDESTESGVALPTPSPSIIWNRSGFPNDDHSNVCRGALVEIEFSRGDVLPLGSGDLRVDECATTSLDIANRFCVPATTVPVKDQKNNITNFVPDVSFQSGVNVGHDYLELKPQDGYNFGKWLDNTWYRVILRGNIVAGVGTSTINLSNTKPCDIDGNPNTNDRAAYCFFFKTGSEDCRLRTVVITPYSYWTSFLEAPLKEHSVGGDIYDLFYTGHGLSEQRCIMMDVSGFNWQWSASNTDYADIYSGANAVKNVQVSSLQNTVGVNLMNPNNAVNINAEVSTGTKNYAGHSPLTIDLSNPKVMDYWPNCLEACTDAEIGARFNLTMSNSNLSHIVGGPAQLFKCFDENCLGTELVILTSLALDPVSGYSVLKINPSTVLERQTIYQVVLSNAYTPAPDHPITRSDVLWSASRYNDQTSFSKPFNQKFVWRFRTKKEACKIDRVEVLPKVFNAPNLTAKTIYSAQPYSAPDACSANGQKLNAANADWDWSSSDSSVASTTEFISKGYNPFCTAGCVRKGSDVPAGAVSRNLRVCGNGIVEAGEDCDPGTAASPVGPSTALGCGLNCLRMGNTKVTTTASGIDNGLCGDGVVSPNKGEECDPNNSVTSTRINCTNNCLHTGSKFSTGASDVSASICGNGYVGVGEDCDLGVDASSTVVTSSMGCSANCLHQGTRLSTKWCNDHKIDMGGFTTSSYRTFCDQAYSQCGDGVENPDEDPGCDTGAGWLANGCNEFCLKKNQGCVVEGCTMSGVYKGSSLLYSVPSICGDRVVGLGEDAWCETNLTVTKTDNYVNPWVLATGVGRGTPTGEPLAQRTNITAETRTDTSGGTPKSNFGQFLIKCGYQSDEECQDANGKDTKYGVAANSCCFVRPQLTAVYPGVTTTNETDVTPDEAIDACPNTYISANFDQMIDDRTLSGNFIIARGTASSSCGTGEEDVTNQIVALDSNNITLVKWYVSLWRHVVYFFKNLIGSDAQANATGVNVQTWCAGQDVGIAEVVPDTYGSGSKIKVDLKKPLAFNTDYAVILDSDIKDKRGVKIGQVGGKNIFWRFSTGGEICTIDKMSVSPNQYYFSISGSTTTLEATASNKDNRLIQPIPGFYAWETLWGPQTNNFVGLINTTSSLNTATAKNQNGEIDIRASANITDNKYTDQRGLVATGRTYIIVFLCENPWPPKDLVIDDAHNIIFPYEDKVSNNDDYSLVSNTFTGLPIIVSPIGVGYYNFLTYYCADNGGTGSYDDLPYLRPAVQVSTNLVSGTSTLKRFLFTNERNSDAIGIQVFPNTGHLTARQWFMNSKEFGGRGFVGNLQDLKVGGYDAVSDGNNIYVDGLDLSSSDPNPVSGTLWTNIYLFSINSDAKPETKNVFDQIIKNLRFNTNLTNYGYCGRDMANPGSSTTCYTDFDCSNGEVCSAQIDKLKRDYTRVRDLSSIENLLNGYHTKNNSYPDLKEGTYLSGQTLSTWPSWSVLGNAVGASLASDPINKLAPSGSCSSSTGKYCLADNNCPAGESCVLHDSITGWSTADRRFSFACNSSSLAYRYVFNSSTKGYKVYSQFENTGLQFNNLDTFLHDFISSTTNFSIFDYPPSYGGNVCLPGETITTMQSGRCGDGKLNLNLSEQCDPPGYKQYEPGCTGADGTKSLNICNADCKGWTPSTTPCTTFSKCGNGKVEAGETCDDGVLNGRYNHCNLLCSGKVPAKDVSCGSGATKLCLDTNSPGYCGDSKFSSAYEVCDPTVTRNNCQVNKKCVGGQLDGKLCNATRDCTELCKIEQNSGSERDSGSSQYISGSDFYYSATRVVNGFVCESLRGVVGERVTVASACQSQQCSFAGVDGTMYGLTKEDSCGYDCQNYGPYCGDGRVQAEFGEECDGNRQCSVDGKSGMQRCGLDCRFSKRGEGVWLRFNDVSVYGNSKFFYNDSNDTVSMTVFPPPMCVGSKCPTLVDGIYGKAVNFDGVDDNILLLSNEDLTTPTFTIMAWIFPATNSYQKIIDKGARNRSGFALGYMNGRAFFEIASEGSSSPVLLAAAVQPPYKWTPVVGTFGNGTMSLFVGGNLVSSTAATMTVSTTVEFSIGQSVFPDGSDYYNFKGKLDELAYFNRILSAEEIKGLSQTNNICIVSSTVTQQAIQTKTAYCGDKNIDMLNDKGIKEECDNGNKNGVACVNGYNKSCSYCSADCSAVIFREATGYCGDGIVNSSSPEVCDTDPTNGNIFSKVSIFGKTNAYDSSKLGYPVKTCSAEKNFKLNQGTIASTANWAIWMLNIATNSTTMQSALDNLTTYKKGTKACINNCLELREDCVECGLNDTGSKVSGYIMNVLEPGSPNPLYWVSGHHATIDLFYSFYGKHTFADEAEMSKYRVAYAYADNGNFDHYSLHPANPSTDNDSIDALINNNPVCSSDFRVFIPPFTFDSARYQIAFNANTHQENRSNFPIVSGDIPGLYDLVLSPVVTNTAHVRIVLSWYGSDDLVGGFFDASTPNPMWEGASLPSTTGRNYATTLLSPQHGVWWHRAALAQSGTHEEAFSVDINQMTTDTYAFYVRTPDIPIANLLSTGRVKVDVYFGYDKPNSTDRGFDGDWPGTKQTYYLKDATPSPNAKANYWHVFNIRKINTPPYIDRIENKFVINDPNSLTIGQEVQISRIRTSELKFYYDY